MTGQLRLSVFTLTLLAVLAYFGPSIEAHAKSEEVTFSAEETSRSPLWISKGNLAFIGTTALYLLSYRRFPVVRRVTATFLERGGAMVSWVLALGQPHRFPGLARCPSERQH